jgi:hypothetical protein
MIGLAILMAVAATPAEASGGAIMSGATSFSSGTGYYVAYNGGTPVFRIGETGSGNQMTWDGSTLFVRSSSITIDGDGITINSTAYPYGALKFSNGGYILSDGSGDMVIEAVDSVFIDAAQDINISAPGFLNLTGTAGVLLSSTSGTVDVRVDGTSDALYPLVGPTGSTAGPMLRKTNGFHGAGGCTIVEDVSVERGIVTGVSCNSAAERRFRELEAEIAQLRALLFAAGGR